MASDRLPRVAHCEKVREDETVYKQTGADLQNGWLGRHGTLFLTDRRMLFVPTLLDTALQARRRQQALAVGLTEVLDALDDIAGVVVGDAIELREGHTPPSGASFWNLSNRLGLSIPLY